MLNNLKKKYVPSRADSTMVEATAIRAPDDLKVVAQKNITSNKVIRRLVKIMLTIYAKLSFLTKITNCNINFKTRLK